MKNLLLCLALFTAAATSAQKADSAWSFGAAANLYFFSDDFIALPVFTADKNHLHLEARYNYEDVKTASVWAGYNFYGGQKLSYNITPMAGLVLGQTNGAAIGLELACTLGNFTLYNEAEHLFDFKTVQNNYFYAWSDFTYAPLDWLYFGISGQRTRLYKTNVDIQHGLILGTAFKNLEAAVYLYNPELDSRFVLLSIAYNF